MGRRIKKAVFKFRPFSKKQKKILTWWLPNSPVHDQDGIIADGAIRSGKTVSMCLSFAMWAMETFNGQNFGMCGKTIGSFRRNVLFWLKLMLKSRGYHVEDHRADNLVVIRRGGKENYFYIFGGKDERSQDLIQGITLAGVFFDEVALMPESFVNQATGRCSVDGSKYWFNCNPDGPYHWFKTNWIDRADEKKLVYLHFTMDDNLSLSERIKARYRAMYTGVFYNRYIEGLWAVVEGIIYDMFDKEKHVTSEHYSAIGSKYVSVDYGTQNATVYLLWEKNHKDSGLLQRNITILAEMRLRRRQTESMQMTWKSSWKESMLNRSLSIRQQHPLSQSLRNEDLRLRKQRMMYLMVFDLLEIC